LQFKRGDLGFVLRHAGQLGLLGKGKDGDGACLVLQFDLLRYGVLFMDVLSFVILLKNSRIILLAAFLIISLIRLLIEVQLSEVEILGRGRHFFQDIIRVF